MAKNTKANNKNNAKKDVNSNFEALKAQMMKKRLMAEELMEEKAEETVTQAAPVVETPVAPITPVVPAAPVAPVTSTAPTVNVATVDSEVPVTSPVAPVAVKPEVDVTIKNINTQSEFESYDNVTDEATTEDLITSDFEDEEIEDILPIPVAPGNNNFIQVAVEQPQSPVSMNKIIIKKIEKPEQPKRITYYLKPETIKKIDRYARLSGMGKSEFVQNILDTVLNNLEIEK